MRLKKKKKPEIDVSTSFPVSGRFERILDFVQELRSIYALSEAEADAGDVRARLVRLKEVYFDCPPTQRMAAAGQVGRSYEKTTGCSRKEISSE